MCPKTRRLGFYPRERGQSVGKHELKNKKEGIFAGYASNNKVIRQLIDLALLQNNMLKGEALNNFVKRSIELI